MVDGRMSEWISECYNESPCSLAIELEPLGTCQGIFAYHTASKQGVLSKNKGIMRSSMAFSSWVPYLGSVMILAYYVVLLSVLIFKVRGSN